ncbi:hypothetical protein DFH08DRAFT_806035 [Mycena albidolilacea]|uniref:Uncharacterized protein n=1 Tax=Mycena albidolilacea TaxID=1033008 RepID=A0AAD7A7I2_9AGAR|nr:hypothetical protein DFH08DRAFT_806035 [Mycena albidolilacea]
MKTFQSLVSAAAALCALSVTNAAAISEGQDSSVAISSSPTSDAFSGSASDSPPPTSTTDTELPTDTGGFVVAGVYTTCLTLTFAAPTPPPTDPTNPGGPITSALPSGVDPSIPVPSASDPPFPSGVDPSGPIQPVAARKRKCSATATPVSDSASASASPTDIGSGDPDPIIPVEDQVFTTCLAFLATATDATATPVDTSTADLPSASASDSAVGSDPVASSSADGL